MKKHIILLTAFTLSAFGTQAQYWNDTGNPSVIPGTNFLGSTNNAPVDFRTNNRFRARINERVTYSSLNTFPNIPADGFTLITPDMGFLNQPPRGPFSRLHLAEGGEDGNAEQWGYRPWQRNGVTFTGNTDQGYIGQKFREGGEGETDMVIQWSDNPGVDKADRLRFIFTSAYDYGATTGMNSEEGLEGMRLWPTWENRINVGIGDFYLYGGDPTERLHVRDGRVRIQQLPTDPEATTLDQYMVVDHDGVVKWRHLPTVPPVDPCASGWSLVGNNPVTAYNGNPCPPQGSRRVGIGTDDPQAKLDVTHTEADALLPSGVRVNLLTNSSTWHNGVNSTVQPMVGGAKLHFATAVQANLYNVGSADASTHTGAFAVFGRNNLTQNQYLERSMAVHGEDYTTAGSIIKQYGGHFEAQNDGGTVGEAHGVYGRAWGATENYSVYGGNPGNGVNDWAGYFEGNVNVTGTGYYVNGIFVCSDAQFKTNIQPLEDPMAIITQLQPHRYDFLTDDFPQMNFPTGGQVGLVAQELEAVIPALVNDTRISAVTDSMGVEITPAVNYKAVNYIGLVPYLIGAVQQQQATIAQMQTQLDQCCAANPGMAPGGDGSLKSAPAQENVQEQRLVIHPNPFTDHTTLSYFVPQAGKVSLQVSTSDGKPLGTLREEQAEAGAFTYEWNTSKLASGTYFCTFMLDGAVVVKRAVKVAR